MCRRIPLHRDKKKIKKCVLPRRLTSFTSFTDFLTGLSSRTLGFILNFNLILKLNVMWKQLVTFKSMTPWQIWQWQLPKVGWWEKVNNFRYDWTPSIFFGTIAGLYSVSESLSYANYSKIGWASSCSIHSHSPYSRLDEKWLSYYQIHSARNLPLPSPRP